MPTIFAARVVTPSGESGPAMVDVEDGRIIRVGSLPADVDLAGVPDVTLVPGFIDIQCNGFDDVDVSRADGDDWGSLEDSLLRQGVTGWCPTIVTRPLDSYGAVLARVETASVRDRRDRPAIVGVHLEGPFLGGAPGAHPVRLIRELDVAWLETLPPIVRVVTLAPEQLAATDAIWTLSARGVVVALGHSVASYEEGLAAADAGASLVTHLFNGMGSWHHRRPGLVGAALTDDRVCVSLIADLRHVHPAALRLAFAAKRRGRVVLVSDAVAWRDDEAVAAGITVVGGAAQNPSGTLVGAVVGLDSAVRNVVNHAGVSLEDAVHAAATAPADLLGLDDRGRIEVGARADLVALDAALQVTSVWIGGEPAWQR